MGKIMYLCKGLTSEQRQMLSLQPEEWNKSKEGMCT